MEREDLVTKPAVGVGGINPDNKVEEAPVGRRSITRRGLLASIGLAGTAFAASAVLNNGWAAGEGVTGHVYGKGNAITNTVQELAVIRTTIGDLRAMSSAVPDAELYYVTDRGQEGPFYYDAADTVSADNTGTVLVSASGARWKRIFDGTVNVKWFGAKGDRISDDTGSIQAALEALPFQQSGDSVPYGASRVYIPRGVYRIASPLFIRNHGTVVCGDGCGVTVLACDAGFAADSGQYALGKWAIIAEPGYFAAVWPRDAMYNVGIKELTLDLNNMADVRGILYRGARNACYIRDVQFSKFASTCVSIGKSDVQFHAVSQGVYVENCYAISDGNSGAGAATKPVHAAVYEITAGNENVFVNCMVAPGKNNSTGAGIHIGNGTYLCGGNKVIACSIANFKGVDITVQSPSGFTPGETVTNALGFTAKVNAVEGGVLKCTVLNSSKYIPEIGQSVTGQTSGASSQVVSFAIGRAIHLDNSWNTTVDCNSALENSAVGVRLDAAATNNVMSCRENFVDHARNFAETVSCAVWLDRAAFNKIQMPTYVSPIYVSASSINGTINFVSSEAAVPRLINRSGSTAAIGMTEFGLKLYGNRDAKATIQFPHCKIQGDAFGGDFQTTKRWNFRDRNDKVRIQIEDSATPSVLIFDGSGAQKVAVTHDGKVLMGGLPVSDPASANQLWQDGSIVKVSGAQIREKSGFAVQSGDGTTTRFAIPHLLNGTPSQVTVTPNNADSAGFLYAEANGSHLFIEYAAPPAAGTDNLKWTYKAKL